MRIHLATTVILLFAPLALGQPKPDDPAFYFDRAAKAYQKGEHDKAIRDLNEVISLDPEHAAAYFTRGLARAHLGWREKAVADFTAGIRLDPNQPLAFFNRGHAFELEGKFDLALADYTEAIRLDPELTAAFVNRGATFAATKAFDKAIADWTEAIRLDPEQAASYFNRGRAWLELGAFDKSLLDLNEAIRIDPRTSVYLLIRSECHKLIGFNLAAALKDADAAIRLAPKSAPAYTQRGKVRAARDEYTEARKDFDEGVRLGPNLPGPFAGRAVFLAWCRDEKHRDAPQAFKDAKRACELTEWKEPKVIEIYSLSLAALGDFESAVQWQKKAMEDTAYMKVAGADARKRLAWYESQTPDGKRRAPRKD